MDFCIADTFADSLAHLTGEEQKAVKMTAFDLQVNPASPGLSFQRLDRARQGCLCRCHARVHPTRRRGDEKSGLRR